MEAKRRKLTMEEMHMGLFQRFCNGEDDAVIAEIKTERHKLRTKKDNIKKFLEEKTDYFWKLVVFFQKLVAEMLADPLKCENKRFQALDELIKILTICCVNSVVSEKSTPTLLFGECRFSPIPQLLTRILESGERIPTNSKVLLLGLIAGFSTRNKGVAMLAGTPLLVDRIALCLTSEDESIRNAAVSTVIVLSKHAKFLKAFLFSNGGYCLGANLNFFTLESLKNEEPRVFQLFGTMAKFDIRSFGRQLSSSPALPKLIDLIFTEDETKPIHNWHSLILKMLMTTFELRDAFGSRTLERAIFEFSETKSDVLLKYLCISSLDAYGRKTLENTNGLELILNEFSADFNSQSFLIVKNLRHFKHDVRGLAAICRNENFLDKVLMLLREHCVDPRNAKCALPQTKQVLRPDSPNFLLHLSELEEERQNAYFNSTNFHKDYVELDSFFPPASHSPRLRLTWSPSHSGFSSSPSPTPSPKSASMSDDSGAESDNWAKISEEPDYLSDEAQEDSERKELSTKEKKDKMGPYLLEIIDWFTHHSENHVLLMKKPVIETLIMLISSLPNSVVERAGRSIKRLVRSHECLPHLLDLKLHLLIIKHLIRRPCLLTRYAQRCPRCEDKRQLGREVIQEISLQANSISGWSFMESLLKSSDEETRFFALSTAVTLIREKQYRNRLYHVFDALNVLFAVVVEILEKVEVAVAELPDETTDEDVFKLQIKILEQNMEKLEAVFFSSASLVSHKMMHDILESQGEYHEAFQAMISKPCQLREPPNDRKVTFKNLDGKVLEVVDVEGLCQNSEYYRGMFENPFLEATTGKREFVVGNEGIEIKDDHFVKFLHLLSGCRGSRCVAIESTSTCVSLVYLSDKYLALELSEQLLSKTGVAQHFLTGSTLCQFASTLVCASATHGRFSDLFFLVLLRYSTQEEINRTLCTMLDLRSCKAFCDMIKEFLQRCVESLPRHPSYRVWI